METLAQAARKDRLILVLLPIAVVVQTVAKLVYGPVERIADLRLAGHTVGDRVLAVPEAARRLPQPLVYLAVTVVVIPIADLLRPGMYVLVLWRTILLVRGQIIVVVQVAGVTVIVVIVVLLAGIRNRRAVVGFVSHPVTVLVRFQAVCGAVPISIRIALIHLAVTVIVQSVAELRCGLVPLAGHVSLVANVGPRAHSVLIHHLARDSARALIHLPVAVIV